MDDETDLTKITLLHRVRDVRDQQAWAEFVERYTPLIYRWSVRNGLQPTDAADVTQEVLAKLIHSMKQFDYDANRGSFRGWLKTVTQNAVNDLGRSFRKAARGSGDTVMQQQLALVSAPETVNQLIKDIEAQHQAELLSLAESRVRDQVAEHTWAAYFQTAVEQQPSNVVANQLGISISDVYVAKSRVIARLKAEVAKLTEDSE